MAWQGPKAALTQVLAVLDTEYTAKVQAVATELGYATTNLALVEVLHVAKIAEQYAFPFAEVDALPNGELTELRQSSTTSTNTVWVRVADKDADQTALTNRLQCHLLALVRLFLNKRANDRTWAITPVEWNTLPPGEAYDQTWIGAVGVRLEVTVIESIT